MPVLSFKLFESGHQRLGGDQPLHQTQVLFEAVLLHFPFRPVTVEVLGALILWFGIPTILDLYQL